MTVQTFTASQHITAQLLYQTLHIKKKMDMESDLKNEQNLSICPINQQNFILIDIYSKCLLEI